MVLHSHSLARSTMAHSKQHYGIDQAIVAADPYVVGSKVVNELVDNWDRYRERGKD